MRRPALGTALGTAHESDRIDQTRTAQLRTEIQAAVARGRHRAWRRMRRLCEDADEFLGHTAEAVRQGDAVAAREPLGHAREVALVVLRLLRQPEPVMAAASGTAVLDEAAVSRVVVVLEALDAQLRDACCGYRGAGRRAGRLAQALWLQLANLEAAAVRGRLATPTGGAA